VCDQLDATIMIY